MQHISTIMKHIHLHKTPKMAVKCTDQGHEFSKRKMFHNVSLLILIITMSRSKFKYILIRLRNVTHNLFAENM
jgi:hypothetical protein